MGRLAVDQRFKGKGLGAALLAEALRRAATAEIAAYALVVDANDESAAGMRTMVFVATVRKSPLSGSLTAGSRQSTW
jgi:GNAT superfamily N-acetyltransferase